MKLKLPGIASALILLTALLAAGCSSTEGTAATIPTSAVSATMLPGEGRTPGAVLSDNMTPPAMDWAAAAAKLGVTEQALKDAVGTGAQNRPPDMAAAAQKLGVSEDELRQALGFTGGPPPGQGGAPPQHADSPGAPPAGNAR